MYANWKFIYQVLLTCEYKVQMAQKISIALNAIPSGSRDLVEFAFFVVVGITAGSLGMI